MMNCLLSCICMTRNKQICMPEKYLNFMVKCKELKTHAFNEYKVKK